jgi:hypothetical protein
MNLGQTPGAPFTAPPVPTALADPQHVAQMKESLELDELRLREAQIEELLITDPPRR